MSGRTLDVALLDLWEKLDPRSHTARLAALERLRQAGHGAVLDGPVPEFNGDLAWLDLYLDDPAVLEVYDGNRARARGEVEAFLALGGMPTPDPASVPSAQGDRPMLHKAGLHGIPGKVVRTLDPHTEADPAALLLGFLAAFGSVVGRGPHMTAGADRHPPRLNVLIVGRTSRARKGSAWSEVERVMTVADDAWVEFNLQSGLASGEGLIAHLEKLEDRRLLIVEHEFVRVLRVSRRDGSILSPVLRDAWDGRVLQNLTKQQPHRVTGAHVSMVGTITAAELRRTLDDSEIANGFANRYLMVWAERSKRLPGGGNLDPLVLKDLGLEVGNAIARAKTIGTMSRSPAAEAAWREGVRGSPG